MLMATHTYTRNPESPLVLMFSAVSSPSCLCHSAHCFCSFVFKSQSGNLLHHVFHHLPQPFHFFHQSRHLCAPLARKPKTLPSYFRPCLSTTRALELYPTTTVAPYQMPAHCYLSSIRSHRSSTSLEKDLLHRFLRRRAQPNYSVYPISLNDDD